MKLYELENGKIVTHDGLKVGDVVKVNWFEKVSKVKKEITLEESIGEYDVVSIYKCEKVEPKINWFEPKADEKYFHVDGFGKIYSFTYKKDEMDNKILKNNKVYRAREEAELASRKEQAKIKILKRIAELNEGWWPDWESDSESKYDVVIRSLDAFYISRSWSGPNKGSEWYLKSRKLANQLINELKDELKLWLS